MNIFFDKSENGFRVNVSLCVRACKEENPPRNITALENRRRNRICLLIGLRKNEKRKKRNKKTFVLWGVGRLGVGHQSSIVDVTFVEFARLTADELETVNTQSLK